jgi:hypothetical protein
MLEKLRDLSLAFAAGRKQLSKQESMQTPSQNASLRDAQKLPSR